jgi:hypothetical protein
MLVDEVCCRNIDIALWRDVSYELDSFSNLRFPSLEATVNPSVDSADASHDATHVLIVDDADDTREMYAAFLSLIGGCRVSEMAIATDVVATVVRHRPDVVVLDLLLPGIDGFDLCDQLRHTSGVKRFPSWSSRRCSPRVQSSGHDWSTASGRRPGKIVPSRNAARAGS